MCSGDSAMAQFSALKRSPMSQMKSPMKAWEIEYYLLSGLPEPTSPSFILNPRLCDPGALQPFISWLFQRFTRTEVILTRTIKADGFNIPHVSGILHWREKSLEQRTEDVAWRESYLRVMDTKWPKRKRKYLHLLYHLILHQISFSYRRTWSELADLTASR